MKSLTPARLLYLTYFILIGGPLFVLATILCCVVVIIASYVGLPASFISKTTKAWSWCCLAVSLCRVTVRGREHLPSTDAPCVVVANHQSAYDIFVLNAYIGIPFKWVMKQGSRTENGRMTRFKKGAFVIASELDVPILPVTIDGAFSILPRGTYLPHPGRVTLTIHPAFHMSEQAEPPAHIPASARLAQQVIASALPESK